MKTLSVLCSTQERNHNFLAINMQETSVSLDLGHSSTGLGVMANFMGRHPSQPCSQRIRMLPICCCHFSLCPWGGWSNCSEWHHSLDGAEPKAHGNTLCPCLSHWHAWGIHTLLSTFTGGQCPEKAWQPKRCLFNHILICLHVPEHALLNNLHLKEFWLMTSTTQALSHV